MKKVKKEKTCYKLVTVTLLPNVFECSVSHYVAVLGLVLTEPPQRATFLRGRITDDLHFT